MADMVNFSGTVEWSGENPGISLKETADGPFVTLASFFRVVLSPHGRGHALVLLQSPQQAGAPGNVCLHDNEKLARYLVSDFVSHFGAWKGLPGLSGLDLQRELAEADIHIPIIFITGHGDIPSSVRAIKDGAVDFLTKPFSDNDLMNAVNTGLAQDRRTRLERAEMVELRARYAALTPRERDVLPLVVSGLLNKQAAAELAISEVTLQMHRRSVMQKMAAASLADLVRMAERLQIPVTHSRRT